MYTRDQIAILLKCLGFRFNDDGVTMSKKCSTSSAAVETFFWDRETNQFFRDGIGQSEKAFLTMAMYRSSKWEREMYFHYEKYFAAQKIIKDHDSFLLISETALECLKMAVGTAPQHMSGFPLEDSERERVEEMCKRMATEMFKIFGIPWSALEGSWGL